ncbi:phosphatase 2C-like domain-containing protein [Cladochytrium replicatum]|nr:phosphatase 2C-like domain-containing protein [Cladochytrium replicatum]
MAKISPMRQPRLTLQVGTSTDVGRRPHQQDEALVHQSLFNLPDCSLFAVFDGHGSDGAKASAFAKRAFVEVLSSLRDSFLRDPETTLRSVFATVHERMTESPNVDTYMSGTTAAVAVIHGNRLITAHVGDSRIALGRRVETGWQAVQLTNDHTCASKNEYDRLISKGARVEQLQAGQKDGPLRIFKGTLPYPGLVVSRSLGDSVATKLGVLSEPDVRFFDITRNDKFLVLGTDGLWDGLAVQAVVEIVSKHTDAGKASEHLTKASLEGMDRQCLDDNTTNVVVRFEWV